MLLLWLGVREKKLLWDLVLGLRVKLPPLLPGPSSQAGVRGRLML